MDDENKKIFVDINEEIPSIVSRIQRHKENDIILVISNENEILRSLINLKILKRKVEEMGKKVYLVKTDSHALQINDISKKRETHDDRTENKHLQQFCLNRNNIKQEASRSDSQQLKHDGNSINIYNSHDVDQNKTKEQNHPEHKVKMFDIVRKVEEKIPAKKKEKQILQEKRVGMLEKTTESRIINKHTEAPIVTREIEKKDLRKSRSNAKKTILLPSINSKIFALFVLAVLTTVVVLICFILPKADIKLNLKSESVAYEFEFLTDETLDNVDFANNKMPIDKLEIIGQQSKQYPTSGKKHLQEKASGEITVFNEYSSSPQRIVANTRFLSKDTNKLFKIKEAVTIPGFSRVEGVDVPGQVKITIYADKIGEDYNIEKSSFYLPGLQGSEKYNFVYARSNVAMKGGINQEVTYFSERDYLTAKENLLRLAKKENATDFENKISEQSIMLEKTKKDDQVKVETDIEIGEVTDKFEMKVTVTNSIDTIDRENLEKMINEKIMSKLDASKKLKENSRNYNISNIAVDNNNQLSIFVNVEQDVVENIEIENIKAEIADKDEESLKSYFRNFDGIKSIDVRLWPFWVKRVPSSYNKINITIDIND